MCKLYEILAECCREIKQNDTEKRIMKPFNLELAKLGHPVCTRDGRKARIICFDKEGNDFPIVALIKRGLLESAVSYTIEGNYYSSKNTCGLDLFMVSEKKEGWINIYQSDIVETGRVRRGIYSSEEEAFKNRTLSDYITTTKINWEE